MKCPYCGCEDSKVVETRSTDDQHAIRRRRLCLECNKRFTTYEKIETIPLVIKKKDGTRESFDRMKVSRGIIRACEKRPVSIKAIERLIDDVERDIQNLMQKEIDSDKIGELVMKYLKSLDEIAYVRFASVYRQFKDVNTFMDEISKLLNEKE